ncbi:hypothetical protein K501DRAFT_229688 [Backusella circina FSU 941]|nr:hypothetical protein K501DRAFT_229688 [Backusella circina FSU 941]
MSYVHSKKPSLPSIQFLLKSEEENRIADNENEKSMSSLPAELQQLSISVPNTFNSSSTSSESNIPPPRVNEKPPSWMIPTLTNNSLFPSRRPPGASHSRSISDLSSLPLPTPSRPSESYFGHPNNAPTPTAHRHQTHRRTVSANNHPSADFFQMYNQPPPSSSVESQPSRAHTNSPPEPVHKTTPYRQHKVYQQQQLFDALANKKPIMYLKKEDGTDKSEVTESGVSISRDVHTGRYYCPFCNKAFNRPSSLRIHTYSHTGEKPFVCQEEGCGRQFSVQSNMRRHLRVHRLGRKANNDTK